jgi:hypothetical protein
MEYCDENNANVFMQLFEDMIPNLGTGFVRKLYGVMTILEKQNLP